ncbi:uncharacterized protein LOC134227249 [Armigeres subalbatus]|uniref:uncharacterized protein LOC134227249 n=1 Tax=Armigeres subalbatus TaxID=124917 RepID=UPI002ED52238
MLIHVKRQREKTPPHTEHLPWRTAVTRDSTSCASQRHTTTDTIHDRITESIIASFCYKFEVTATIVAYAEASGQGFRIERSILPDVSVFSRLLGMRRSNRFSTQNGTHLCYGEERRTSTFCSRHGTQTVNWRFPVDLKSPSYRLIRPPTSVSLMSLSCSYSVT